MGRIRRPWTGRTDFGFRAKIVDALFKGEARTAFLNLAYEQQRVVAAAALKLATRQWNNIGHQLNETELVLLEGWIDRKLPKLPPSDILTVYFPDETILEIDSEHRVVNFRKGRSCILTIIDDPIQE